MKKYMITFAFVIIASFGFAQTSAAAGTYQLMTTNVKSGEVFTTSLLQLIESKREINSTVILKIGKFTWVKILSTNAINDPNFVPFGDEIIEVSLSDITDFPKENTPTN